jgi:hypothetical protein
MGTIPVDGSKLTWNTSCFESVSASALFDATDGSAVVTVDFSAQISSTCMDLYFVGDIHAVHPVEAFEAKTHVLTFKGDLSAAEIEWTQRNGFRVFLFPNNTEDTLGQILATVSLFYPAIKLADIPQDAADRNLEFLSTMVYYNMSRRVVENVILNESQINDGDMFGVRFTSSTFHHLSDTELNDLSRPTFM